MVGMPGIRVTSRDTADQGQASDRAPLREGLDGYCRAAGEAAT